MLQKTLPRKKSIENVLDYFHDNIDANFFNSFQDSSLIARKENIGKLKALLAVIQKDLNCAEDVLWNVLKDSP